MKRPYEIDPLVSEKQFVATQAIDTAPTPADGTRRHYSLAGLYPSCNQG
ncbi:hypothetical protein HDA35_005798 [Micromonospora purpureochromogenes]|uniref:ATP-grasp target RiPP n=1 Tax=Micromonospora purpureochromogenes TaxID=47872 RepID=A0ABX2RXC3_9ACTN|nr:hypothetical protein [Micromonospora purpureochromogenes]